MRENRIAYVVLVGKLQERDNFRDIGEGERTIL